MSQQVIIISVACLTGLVVVVAALLRGWHGWLELKRTELNRSGGTHMSAHEQPEIEQMAGTGGARIEVADLKERVRKLEAIASGVDL